MKCDSHHTPNLFTCPSRILRKNIVIILCKKMAAWKTILNDTVYEKGFTLLRRWSFLLHPTQQTNFWVEMRRYLMSEIVVSRYISFYCKPSEHLHSRRSMASPCCCPRRGRLGLRDRGLQKRLNWENSWRAMSPNPSIGIIHANKSSHEHT